VPPATELVVLFAPPPQRRSHQLPAFIPNGPWPSPPPDTDDAQPRRPINAALPRDRSILWLRNAAIGLCALAAAVAAVSFTAQYRRVLTIDSGPQPGEVVAFGADPGELALA
jgi:hypothetical protein